MMEKAVTFEIPIRCIEGDIGKRVQPFICASVEVDRPPGEAHHAGASPSFIRVHSWVHS